MVKPILTLNMLGYCVHAGNGMSKASSLRPSLDTDSDMVSWNYFLLHHTLFLADLQEQEIRN